MFLKMAVDFMMVIPYDYATIGSQENFMGQVFTSYSRREHRKYFASITLPKEILNATLASEIDVM